MLPQPPERLSGKTVAVVGSGPAGLAAAQQLTRAGHTVAVYERDEEPGGLLRFGIPDFKLEKVLVERRIEQMKQEGTRFRCGVEIGRDMTWSELRRRYDAMIVATGATVPRPLQLPGREHSGVHYAMEYLSVSNRTQTLKRSNASRTEWSEAASGPGPEPAAPELDAAGKHVVVIGGGDTGADCIGTAHRQGARSVTNLAIGRKPGETRSEAQPWPVHPTLFEVSSSHEEGGERRYLASTVEFLADENGRVRALSVAETGFTEHGREPVPGTEHLIDADLVLIAMGFSGPESIEDPHFPLPFGARGAYERGSDYSTSLPGVFVAGDAGRGQSLIVWAIAEGRAAAASADAFLTGSTVLPSPIPATARAFS